MTTAFQRIYPPLLIVLLALLVYANSFPGSFLVADLKLVGQNPFVTEPELGGMLTSDFWGPDARTGEYRPLAVLSLALDHSLYGTDPLGYHLHNVLLGAAASLLLFMLLCRLNIPLPVSWLSAALFAVHPAQAVAVNEVVGRSQLLGAVFCLLALIWSRREGKGQLAGVAALYTVALLSHESALVLLAAVPLLEAFLSGKAGTSFKKRLPLYLSLLLVTAGWLLLRAMVLGEPASDPGTAISFFDRLAGGAATQVESLVQLLFPLGLAGGTAISAQPGLSGGWLGAVALLVAIAALLALRGWKHRSLWSLAVLLYVSAFLISLCISLAGLGSGDVSLFATAFIGLGAASLLSCLPRPSGQVRLAWFASLALVLLLGALTLERNQDFKSPEAQMRSELERNPMNAAVWTQLGEYFSVLGQDAQAREAFVEALGLAPESGEANLSYAIFLARRDRTDEAVDFALKAVQASPESFESEAYLILGMGYLRLENPEESLIWLDKLGDHFQGLAIYWETRGMAQEFTGQPQEALKSYLRELETAPADPSATRIRAARLMLWLERIPEAETLLLETLEDRETAEGRNFLGVALAQQGRFQEAFDAFQGAVLLSPDNDGYMQNFEMAARELEAAVEALPE